MRYRASPEEKEGITLLRRMLRRAEQGRSYPFLVVAATPTEDMPPKLTIRVAAMGLHVQHEITEGILDVGSQMIGKYRKLQKKAIADKPEEPPAGDAG